MSIIILLLEATFFTQSSLCIYFYQIGQVMVSESVSLEFIRWGRVTARVHRYLVFEGFLFSELSCSANNSVIHKYPKYDQVLFLCIYPCIISKNINKRCHDVDQNEVFRHWIHVIVRTCFISCVSLDCYRRDNQLVRCSCRVMNVRLMKLTG